MIIKCELCEKDFYQSDDHSCYEYRIDHAHKYYTQYGTDIEDAIQKWCSEYDYLVNPNIENAAQYIYISIYDTEEERSYEYRIEGEWHLNYICKKME